MKRKKKRSRKGNQKKPGRRSTPSRPLSPAAEARDETKTSPGNVNSTDGQRDRQVDGAAGGAAAGTGASPSAAGKPADDTTKGRALADASLPNRFDAPARALAANLSAFSSKSQSGLYSPRRRDAESSAPPSSSEDTAGSGLPRHDFRRPSLLAEHQVRALESLHRKYAERASSTLSAMVRDRARVTLTEVRQCSYFDFIRSLHNPTSLQLVYCTPGKQPFVAEMTPAVLFPILDRLLGSNEDDSPYPVRPFTSMEAALVNWVFCRLLNDLAESWSTGTEEHPVERFRFDIRESEYNPMLMQVFGPSEPTVVVELELSVESSSGALHVCLPIKSFEPMIGALVEASTLCPKPLLGDQEQRDALRERLETSGVTLTAELPPIPIALEDLVKLRPGDVIDTEVNRSSDLSVKIEERDVLLGQVVTHAGRRAVRVTGFQGEDSILGVEVTG